MIKTNTNQSLSSMEISHRNPIWKAKIFFPINFWIHVILGKIFQQLAFKEGPPLSPWWEAHVTSKTITNTHIATPTIIIITQQRNWSSLHQSTKLKSYKRERKKKEKRKKRHALISSVVYRETTKLLSNQVESVIEEKVKTIERNIY